MLSDNRLVLDTLNQVGFASLPRFHHVKRAAVIGDVVKVATRNLGKVVKHLRRTHSVRFHARAYEVGNFNILQQARAL